MIQANSLEFLKNLAQYDYDSKYYDLHNDYDCENIILDNGTLQIKFRHTTNSEILSLNFKKVEIIKIDFFNIKNVADLTLDILYRGRAVTDGILKDVSEDGKGYFYLEFYEGQKIEFWSKEFDLSYC